MKIDFSILSDDQLVELVRAACGEAVDRGAAVEAAARAAMLTQAERAQIARGAAEREAERVRREEADRVARQAAAAVREQAEAALRQAETEKQQKLWAKKKQLAQMVETTLGTGWKLNVWQRDGDKRVYLDGVVSTRKLCLYVTGNVYNPPGKLTQENFKLPATRLAEVRAILEKAARDWNTVGFECTDALKPLVDAPPIPEEFLALVKEREAVEAKAQAAKAEKEQKEVLAAFGGDPVAIGYHKPLGQSVVVVRHPSAPEQAKLVACRDQRYTKYWPKYDPRETLIEFSPVNEWPVDLLAGVVTMGFREDLERLAALQPIPHGKI